MEQIKNMENNFHVMSHEVDGASGAHAKRRGR